MGHRENPLQRTQRARSYLAIVLFLALAGCQSGPDATPIVLALPTLVVTGAPLVVGTVEPTATPTPEISLTAVPTATLQPMVTSTATLSSPPTVTTTPEFSCPRAPLLRLQIDDLARVTYTDGRALRIRSSPEVLPDNVIRQLPEGTDQIKIIGGPVCTPRPDREDAFIFWKIRLQTTELVGWAAEGDFENYYLEKWP